MYESLMIWLLRRGAEDDGKIVPKPNDVDENTLDIAGQLYRTYKLNGIPHLTAVDLIIYEIFQDL